MAVIDNKKFSNSSSSSDSDSVPQRYNTVEFLKRKYEAKAVAGNGFHNNKPAPFTSVAHKIVKRSKVKQMASMFNHKIAQITRNVWTSKKMFPEEVLIPDPTSPEEELENKDQENSTFFSCECNNLANLTVKKKAELYTQFINDMRNNKPKLNKPSQSIETRINIEEATSGKVATENRLSVKQLLKRLEAKCAPPPRQTVTPLFKHRFNPVRGQAKSTNKKPHISTLTVTLQPSNTCTEVRTDRRLKSLPRRRRVHEQVLPFELGIIESCNKRKNCEMRSALSIESHAPPKKIRNIKIFCPNQQMENLLFTWLSERQKEQQQIAKESNDKKVQQKLEIERKAQEFFKSKRTTAAASPPPVIEIINKKTKTNTSQLEENESGVSPLPKTTTDESQVDTHDKESGNSEKDMEFSKCPKPARKKKMRKCKMDTSTGESLLIDLTDSDDDYRNSEMKFRSKMFCEQVQTNGEMIEDTGVAVDMPSESSVEETLPLDINSPRKIRSAYTLTVCSPTSSNTSDNLYENTRSWLNAAVERKKDQIVDLDNNKTATMTTTASSFYETTDDVFNTLNSRMLTDSFVDQGFETGSNDMESPARAPSKKQTAEELCPLFIKLDLKSPPADTKQTLVNNIIKLHNNVTELSSSGRRMVNPLSFSTPIKAHSQNASFSSNSSHQELFSPIPIAMKNSRCRKFSDDAESRCSSLPMQVIREGQPLEQQEITSPRNSNSRTQMLSPNSLSSTSSSGLVNKTSQFWIKCGDFMISLDIFYNDADRLRLLYEIFGQKSSDNSRDLHFGIDNHKFSMHNSSDHEDISKRLPASKKCSHYWFSTGDLAIPFSGKLLSPAKIQRLFHFIKASVEESGHLRFGVDSVEFSNVSEFSYQSAKFSMDSNYSMLVGLQSGNSNGLEGRSKYAWPYCKSTTRLPAQLGQPAYECEDSEDNDSYRLSFTPFGHNHYDLAALGSQELSTPRNSEVMMDRDSFGCEYENESLDNIFDEKGNQKAMPTKEKHTKASIPVPEMLDSLKTKHTRLSSVREKLSTWRKAPNAECEALDALKGTPQYIHKLREVVAEITSKFGGSNGLATCTLQQLETYMFFLSHYADICLRNCSQDMRKLLDVILDEKALQV